MFPVYALVCDAGGAIGGPQMGGGPDGGGLATRGSRWGGGITGCTVRWTGGAPAAPRVSGNAPAALLSEMARGWPWTTST